MIRIPYKKPKKVQNLLTMIPVLKEGLFVVYCREKTTVFVPRKSWIERQAIRLLKQPSVIQVKLDAHGAAVIKKCDGQHSISEIASALYDEFGEAVEPLLPRLVKFIEMMEVNNWIEWRSGR